MLLIGLSSCYYDVEEELYPSLECQIEDMSFSADIATIISSECLVCHSQAANFGNITLEGHSNVLTYVNNGLLLGAIRQDPGFSPMPQNASKLLDCEIEKIAAWINQGAPNN